MKDIGQLYLFLERFFLVSCGLYMQNEKIRIFEISCFTHSLIFDIKFQIDNLSSLHYYHITVRIRYFPFMHFCLSFYVHPQKRLKLCKNRQNLLISRIFQQLCYLSIEDHTLCAKEVATRDVYQKLIVKTQMLVT